MSAVRMALVAVVEETDGTVTIQDANGNAHQAGNAQALWVILKQVLADPTIPEMEAPNSNEVEFEGVLGDYVKAHLPPGLDRLAAPFVRSTLGVLGRLSKKTTHTPRR